MKSSEEYLLRYKTFILKAVKAGKWEEAENLINRYQEYNRKDPDIYAIKASICILQKRLDDAFKLLKLGYRIDPQNINLLVNLASYYEKIGDIQHSISFYSHADDIADGKNRDWIHRKIAELSKQNQESSNKNSRRIMFFVKPGLDAFLDDIIFSLMRNYEVRKCIVGDQKQIDAGMEWADICWFEWCNEITLYASRHKLAHRKMIINRIHRIDLYSPYRDHVNWENIDKVIVVNDHIKRLLIEILGKNLAKNKVVVIQNGINLSKFAFGKRTKGYNLAFAAIFRLIKNPAMPLQILKRLMDKDSRYRLFVAGKMQDPWVKMYWEHQIDKLGLKGNVVFQHWQMDMNHWLDDKDYLLSTSFYESFGYTIAEAMTKGIKPVIHDFPFAAGSWPKHLLFGTIDQACDIIIDADYRSNEYREFIEQNYRLEDKIESIRSLIDADD